MYVFHFNVTYRMATTRRVPVFGSKPPCAKQSRLDSLDYQLGIAAIEQSRTLNKPKEVICFENLIENESTVSLNTKLCSSYNFVDFIRNREYGFQKHCSLNKYYSTRHIITHNLFKERSIPLNTLDAVLCSQWISNQEIVFGTKCSKLMVYDINSHKLSQIKLTGHMSEAVNRTNGIRSLKINPSRSLMATGIQNIIIYKLPTLNPIALVKGAEKDRIYDIEWFNDAQFISGSYGSKLTVWEIQNQFEEHYESNNLIPPVTQFPRVKNIGSCDTIQRVRAITYNKHLNEMLTLSLNGCVYLWSVEPLKPILFEKCSSEENNCIALKDDGSCYAVGYRSHIQLIEPKRLKTIKKIPVKRNRCGIKSISFQDDIITIGTGDGVLMFFDIRAEKYLKARNYTNKDVVLKTSKGVVFHEEEFMNSINLQTMDYSPAIYTHCYDYSGTRLFSAGGPHFSNFYGHYAGLWQ